MTDTPDQNMRDDLLLSEADLRAAGFQGFIDAIEDGRVFGWAYDPENPAERISVELFHGRNKIGNVVADRHREDLVGHGDGSGHHAFVFTLPKDLWSADPSTFHACYAGTGVPLLRGPRCSLLRRTAFDPEAVAASLDPGRSAVALSDTDFGAVVARMEACERAVVSLVHMAHPSSDLQRDRVAQIESVRESFDRVARSIEDLEAFTVRNDERLKKLEINLNRLDAGIRQAWFFRFDVWALVAAIAACGLTAIQLAWGN